MFVGILITASRLLINSVFISTFDIGISVFLANLGLPVSKGLAINLLQVPVSLYQHQQKALFVSQLHVFCL